MMRSFALAALGVAQVWAATSNLAVVRVFSTDEEVMLLRDSGPHWETVMPCANKSTMSMIDLILVYSKDLSKDMMAHQVVMDLEDGFKMKMDMDMYGSTNMTNGTMYNWMTCFSSIKHLSAMLNPEEDVYDSNGYTTNKHWVKGPNTVFKSIMDAMYTGSYMNMYDSFFLMEMDAVPIKNYWLDQFEMEAHEMPGQNMAVRGSQYLGDKWDLFKQMMPDYLVEHINGNAIYNLKHNWTQYLYTAFTSQDNSNMMEEMAFDVAFAMITMAAMQGDASFAPGWAAAMGNNMTYNHMSMLVGNYANTLLNTSFEFPTYIRHGSSKNLFENLPDDSVTLGVAFFDHQGHLQETIPTNHPFKKILGIAYFDQATMTEEIVAPGGNVTLTMQQAMYEPYYHLCEIASLVDTTWFALTDNYHIVKAPVSVLMETMDKPVLPYVLKGSKYCGERPNCKASMEQAEDLFSIDLNYHHDTYEVLYKTKDAKAFCAAWKEATMGKGYGNCTLSFGPTADDYIAWKISSPDFNISSEFVPKDKTRYGWRAWTSLWNPAPVDDRQCTTTLYGDKEYLETLGNISKCAVNYVENAPGCIADTDCMWRPMFETGVCMLDPKSVTTTTTVEAVVFSTVEVSMPITVEDPTTITDNATITTAMKTGFASLMGVSVDRVTLTFESSRLLGETERQLATTLIAIYTVKLDSEEEAQSKQVAIETVSLAETNRVITNAIKEAGFTGTVEVTGKSSVLVPVPTTTTTVATTSESMMSSTSMDDSKSSTMASTTQDADGDDGDEEPPSFAKHFGSFSVLTLLASAMLS